MFQPTHNIQYQADAGYTPYGQPKRGAWHTERCRVVHFRTAAIKTSVRTDSSASRGAAQETISDAIFLLAPDTKIKLDTILSFHGQQLRVTTLEPRFNTFGQHEHTQVGCAIWSGK